MHPDPFRGRAKRAAAVALFSAVVAGAAAPSARVVEAADLDGDGRHSGADIERALAQCRAEACRIELLPVVYEDVALRIDAQFTQPLVLQGAGMGKTVLRAPVPAPSAVIWVQGGPAGLVIRDLSLDGRKKEQTDRTSPEDSVGIRVVSPALATSPQGRVERVEAVEFMSAGVRIREGRGWVVTDSVVRHVGCHVDEPCPGLRRPATDRHVAGRQVAGFGIQLLGAGASGSEVVGNRIEDVTKIGIEVYTPNATDRPSSEWVRDVRVRGNEVRDALSAGITVNGGAQVRIEGNVVERMGGRGARGNAGSGITSSEGASDLEVLANRVRETEGPGIRLGALGPVRVDSNEISRACTAGRGEFGAIEAVREGASVLAISGNAVDAKGCSYGILVRHWGDVRISGGSVRGGRVAAIALSRVRGGRVGRVEIHDASHDVLVRNSHGVAVTRTED